MENIFFYLKTVHTNGLFISTSAALEIKPVLFECTLEERGREGLVALGPVWSHWEKTRNLWRLASSKRLFTPPCSLDGFLADVRGGTQTRDEKKWTRRFLPSFPESLVAVFKGKEGGIEAEGFYKRSQNQIDTLPRPLVLQKNPTTSKSFVFCVSPKSCHIKRISYHQRLCVTYFAFFPARCHGGVTESHSTIKTVYTWSWHPPDGSATACLNPQLQCVCSDGFRSGCTAHGDKHTPVGHWEVLAFLAVNFPQIIWEKSTLSQKSCSFDKKRHVSDVTKGADLSQGSGDASRQVELQATGPSGLKGHTKGQCQNEGRAYSLQRSDTFVKSWSFIVTSDRFCWYY